MRLTSAAMIIAFLGCISAGEDPLSAAPEFQIVDSLGIELGPPEYMFGNMVMSTCSTGDIIVLDNTLHSVRMYSPECSFIKERVFHGGGPEEFSSPEYIAPLEDGGFLIGSPVDRKIATYNRDMEFAGELLLTRGDTRGPFSAAVLSESLFVCSFQRVQGDSVTGLLSVHSSTLDDAECVLMKNTLPWDPDEDWQDATRAVFTVTERGTVTAGFPSRDMLLLYEFSPGGDTLAVFHSAVEPSPYTEEELTHMAEILGRRLVHAFGTAGSMEQDIPGFRYSFTDLYSDSENRIWLQHDRILEPGFTVYSAEWDSLFTIEFTPPGNQRCDCWKFSITPWGYSAAPSNPEFYPLLYILRLTEQ